MVSGGRCAPPLPGVHPRTREVAGAYQGDARGEAASASGPSGLEGLGTRSERGHPPAAHARRGVRGPETCSRAAGARGRRAPGCGGREAGGVLRLGREAMGRGRTGACAAHRASALADRASAAHPVLGCAHGRGAGLGTDALAGSRLRAEESHRSGALPVGATECSGYRHRTGTLRGC